MHAYRDPQRPPSDEEVAALADLAGRVGRTKTRIVLPVLLLGMGSGIAACLAHVMGYWSVTGRLSDDSYVVSKSTVVVAMILGVVAGGLPGFLAYRLAMHRLIERWKREARARFKLDEETLDDLAALFAPRSGSAKRAFRDVFYPPSERR